MFEKAIERDIEVLISNALSTASSLTTAAFNAILQLSNTNYIVKQPWSK